MDSIYHLHQLSSIFWHCTSIPEIKYQSTESTEENGCIWACKSSNREIVSLIPFVKPEIK